MDHNLSNYGIVDKITMVVCGGHTQFQSADVNPVVFIYKSCIRYLIFIIFKIFVAYFTFYLYYEVNKNLVVILSYVLAHHCVCYLKLFQFKYTTVLRSNWSLLKFIKLY